MPFFPKALIPFIIASFHSSSAIASFKSCGNFIEDEEDTEARYDGDNRLHETKYRVLRTLIPFLRALGISRVESLLLIEAYDLLSEENQKLEEFQSLEKMIGMVPYWFKWSSVSEYTFLSLLLTVFELAVQTSVSGRNFLSSLFSRLYGLCLNLLGLRLQFLGFQLLELRLDVLSIHKVGFNAGKVLLKAGKVWFSNCNIISSSSRRLPSSRDGTGFEKKASDS